MNEHDKQVSSVEATANAAPSQGRRRLVKGIIIGAPAILMVRNGYSSNFSSLNLTETQATPRICSSLGVDGLGNKQSFYSFFGTGTTIDPEVWAKGNCSNGG